ncbi:MAG: nucleoside deaminase [Candidatus Cloacimonetes bacterium]|nr:nucleoside deaminase [Candidatus Cloacimonadota bacterium]
MVEKYSNEYWMEFAIEEARLAFQEYEVPIGAILIKENKIVAADHNRTNQFQSSLAHAEKLIIEKVISSGDKFLYDYSLFVTVEPCLMCAGIIIWSRVGKVVFGCYDPKAGAVGSIYNVLLDKNFSHHPGVISGVLERDCSELISRFFKEKR